MEDKKKSKIHNLKSRFAQHIWKIISQNNITLNSCLSFWLPESDIEIYVDLVCRCYQSDLMLKLACCEYVQKWTDFLNDKVPRNRLTALPWLTLLHPKTENSWPTKTCKHGSADSNCGFTATEKWLRLPKICPLPVNGLGECWKLSKLHPQRLKNHLKHLSA